MIKSNKKLKVVSATLNVEEIIIISPRIENISTDMDREVYLIPIQDFYLQDDVKYPLPQRNIELDIMEVMSKPGGLKEKITARLLEKINEDLPYGSQAGDWERE